MYCERSLTPNERSLKPCKRSLTLLNATYASRSRTPFLSTQGHLVNSFAIPPLINFVKFTFFYYFTSVHPLVTCTAYSHVQYVYPVLVSKTCFVIHWGLEYGCWRCLCLAGSMALGAFSPVHPPSPPTQNLQSTRDSFAKDKKDPLSRLRNISKTVKVIVSRRRSQKEKWHNQN